MEVITLDSPLKIGIKNIPMPERKNDSEVLIKVRALGICGSDIGAYRGVNPTVSYPRIIGHEIGGEVVSISDNSKGIIVCEPWGRWYCLNEYCQTKKSREEVLTVLSHYVA